MVTDLQVLFVIQLALVFLIVFDSMRKREWMSERKLILIVLITVLVPILGAVIYIAVVRRYERQLVVCPQCGAEVVESDDECHNCGFVPSEEPVVEEEGLSVCEQCGREFDTVRGLMTHKGRQHRQEGDDESTDAGSADVTRESYTCDVCGAVFDSERGLHIHQSVKHS